VSGRWRTPKKGILLELENAGTAVRFLTAAAILGAPGSDGITIDGNSRMRERPIGELIDMLAKLGAQCTYLNTRGYPPVRIDPVDDLNTIPDSIEVPTTLSSQFISAIILLAPHLPKGLTIRFTGEVTSASYIRMTTSLLRSLGARIDGDPPSDIRIHPGPPRAQVITIEPDASSATYFFAAAALFPGATYTCPGLANSLQADAGFPRVLASMSGAGVPPASVRASRPDRQTIPQALTLTGSRSLTAIDADLSDMPDAAMTLAAIACFAQGTTTIRGLRTLRVKETDRIEAISAELTKLGVRIEVIESSTDIALRITPPASGIDCSPAAPPITFDTYRDHRMAMSLALIGLRRPNISIRDPGCVGKTYPNFWDDLSKLARCAT
jgi:3-phosphoshikimate 1-carboxyvinyltransferase